MLEAVEYDRISSVLSELTLMRYYPTPLTAEQEMARFEREQKAKRSDGESASSFASPFAPADKQYAPDYGVRNLNYVPAEKPDFIPVEEEEELPVGDTIDGKALLERKMTKFQYCLTCGFLLMPGETECFRCKKDQ